MATGEEPQLSTARDELVQQRTLSTDMEKQHPCHPDRLPRFIPSKRVARAQDKDSHSAAALRRTELSIKTKG